MTQHDVKQRVKGFDDACREMLVLPHKFWQQNNFSIIMHLTTRQKNLSASY